MPRRCLCGRLPAFFFALLALAVCSSLSWAGERPGRESGIASWYGTWHHGRITANGERFNMYAMTAAHKTLPFGTIVVVRRARGGRGIVVRINDRGPYVEKRIIDLSYAAAQGLGMDGIAQVTLEVACGKNGRPLSPATRFYVRLGREDADMHEGPDKKVAQLVRLGIRDAASMLCRLDGDLLIGPFRSFAESHDAYARIAHAHPASSIMLAGRHAAEPVFAEYQCDD